MVSAKQFVLMGFFLLFGGLTTNAQNDYLQFTTVSFPGYIGQLVAFNYPWFGNFLMFTAMSMMFALWIYYQKKTPKRVYSGYSKPTQKLMSNPWVVLVASALFDLIASGMMSVGLNLGVSASVYQMLNGSIMLFTPILSWFFLKRKIVGFYYIGMAICLLGLIIVGISSYCVGKFFAQEQSTSTTTVGDMILGMLLIILAYLLYAGQFVVEEYIMQGLDCHPAEVVCIEGVYGLLITICFMMPVFDLLGVENDFNAFVFDGAEPMILLPQMLFFVCVACYNAFGYTITKLISANHRTILEGLRGLVVWAIGLLERVMLGIPFGEKLNGWASAIELAGFVVLLFGGFIFYEIIKLPAKFGGSQMNGYQQINKETKVEKDNETDGEK